MATVPEQIMRARYSAYVLKLIDFIIVTYHSSCNAERDADGINTSANLDWQRLDVLSAPEVNDNTTIGFVEFKAYLLDDDVEHCMHERSRFIKEDGLWYYIDGVFPDTQIGKIGRNEPCVCGSGKKHKKCCGKA